MMRRTFIEKIAFCVLTASALSVNAQDPPADSLTMDQVVRDVVHNNDRIKAAAFMEEAARRQVGPAGAWDDPMLMLELQNVPPSFRFDEDPMTMKMVGLSQKLSYAGDKGLAKKAKYAEYEAAHEDARDIAIDLISAARTAYAELYYHNQLIEDLERQRVLSKQIVTSTQSRMSANLAELGELASAQAALWRVESEILTHQNDANSAYSSLCGLRGVRQTVDLPVVAAPLAVPIPESANVWVDSAYVTYPPLRRLSHQADSYGFSAAAASRMGWPMLELGASYGFRSDLLHADGLVEPQDNMATFQVRLSLPVFAGRQQHEMAASMRAMQRNRELEGSQLRRDIEATLRTMHQRAQRSAESVRLYREHIIPADEQAFQNALNEYSTGRISLPDLLTYALSVYGDRVTASQLELTHEEILIEVDRYLTDGDRFLQK